MLLLTATAWPRPAPDAVLDAFGPDAGPPLLDRARELYDEACAQPVAWDRETLAEATHRVRGALAAAHPELDAAALHALGSAFAYGWR